MRTKLSSEKVSELHKFQTQKTFQLIRMGMALGLIPFSEKINLQSRVRKQKLTN
jgi:hypothetical protein